MEAILKRHLIALTAEVPDSSAAASAAASQTAAAAATAAAATAAAAGKEGEARWASIHKCVETIVDEVRSIRQTQKQTQGGAFSQRMADLLGKAIDAAEVRDTSS